MNRRRFHKLPSMTLQRIRTKDFQDPRQFCYWLDRAKMKKSTKYVKKSTRNQRKATNASAPTSPCFPRMDDSPSRHFLFQVLYTNNASLSISGIMHIIPRTTGNISQPTSQRKGEKAILSCGDIVLVFYRDTLSLWSDLVSTYSKWQKRKIVVRTMWLTLYTPTSLDASSNMLLRNEMTMNWAFLVRSLM